ncbi:hypothetical protein EV424DRAFT_1594776 [Suillus variegatus]|nr:hypothetical protein EV424DRAFT_1594776 [Suillus variegatus]
MARLHQDTKSSSGTFLNHVHISCPGSESAPYQLKDGDFVQLGVDYQGGMVDVYKSVRIQIEIGRDFTQSFSTATYSPAVMLPPMSYLTITAAQTLIPRKVAKSPAVVHHSSFLRPTLYEPIPGELMHNLDGFMDTFTEYAVLHEVRRYDEAIEALKIMLFKLDNAIDPKIRELRQQYVSPSEAHDAIQRAIHIQLENAPLRLVNTFTGRLCDRQTQINTFIKSEKYKEVLSSLMAHATLQTELIKAIVTEYFSWVMLSHRWENKEPRLHDIQDKDVYSLTPLGTVAKLQSFCKTARDAGYRWAWSDTCCIDQSNNFELQESVNSITWNTRGWTVQEFLAPHTVRFYRADWTLYLNDRSPNHKTSLAIMQELEDSTGIDAQALVAFRPGMRGAREKLRWASSRVTTLQEDIAYSLFGIFHVHLPVIYGEKRQNALGRLLQEIIAHSGDITPLDWIGKASEFNSCLPADITSYKASPSELTSKLYTLLDNLSAPRFAHSRLQLPCIVFPITELRRRRGPDSETSFTYDIKADGLQDLLITSEDKLIQFSPTRPTQQTFLLVRPWNRHDLGLPDFAEPDFADDAQDVDDWTEPVSRTDGSVRSSLVDSKLADSEARLRELRLVVRLGQPFGALLLAQQRGGEYKRVASDHLIIAKVKDMASIDDTMDIRTLEIL